MLQSQWHTLQEARVTTLDENMKFDFQVEHDYVMNAGLVEGGNTKDKNNYFDCHAQRYMGVHRGAQSCVWRCTVGCTGAQRCA